MAQAPQVELQHQGNNQEYPSTVNPQLISVEHDAEDNDLIMKRE